MPLGVAPEVNAHITAGWVNLQVLNAGPGECRFDQLCCNASALKGRVDGGVRHAHNAALQAIVGHAAVAFDDRLKALLLLAMDDGDRGKAHAEMIACTATATSAIDRDHLIAQCGQAAIGGPEGGALIHIAFSRGQGVFVHAPKGSGVSIRHGAKL